MKIITTSKIFRIPPILLCLLGLSTTLIAQYFPGVQTKQHVENGYDYIAYLPEGYDNTKEFPLLFYLHGGQGISDGEDGFEDYRTFDFGPPRLISTNKWPEQAKEFIVIVPHLPRDVENYPVKNDQLWDIGMVNKVMSDAKSRYKVSESQIYLTGISLGAKGVLDYAMQYPSIPAAVVAISGSGILDDACKMKDIPLWAFHGENDYLSYNGDTRQEGRYGSLVIVDKINSCIPSPLVKAKFTLFEVWGHDAEVWESIYNLSSGYNIYSWFLNHAKNSTNNSIFLKEGPDRKFIQSDFPIAIKAEVFDYKAEITEIKWNYDFNLDDQHDIYSRNDSLIIRKLPVGNYTFDLTSKDVGGNSSTETLLIEVLDNAFSGIKIDAVTLYNKEGEIISEDLSRFKVNTEIHGNEFNIVAKSDANGVRAVRWTLNANENFRTVIENIGGDGVDYGEPGFIQGEFYMLRKNGPYWKPQNDSVYTITITPYGTKDLKNPGPTKVFRIGINTDAIPLPVEFLDVSAKRDGDKVIISWSTASEKNNDFFTIERSSKTKDSFEAIGIQRGAGNSHQIRHYSFTDDLPLHSSTYYRIKQTDFDGQSDYSKIVNVNDLITSATHTPPFDIIIFPNPIEKEYYYVKVNTMDPYSEISLVIIDALGNIHNTHFIKPHQDISPDGYLLSDSNALSPGLYCIIATQGNRRIKKKLLVR